MASILTTIKKDLGIPETVTDFDTDVTMAINTAINALTQIGVGPEEGYRIQGVENEWEELLGEDPGLEEAKSYIFIKTKMLFDPVQMSSIVRDCYDRFLKEIEWRLATHVELKETDISEPPDVPEDSIKPDPEEGGDENQNE